MYTAPSVGGTYTVTATSVADPSKAGTAQVYVPLVVTVIPSWAGIFTGSTLDFLAQVTGSSDPRVSWNVLEALGGAVSQTGLYQAPSLAGLYHVTATSQVDPKAGGLASVAVVQDILYHVDPSYATVNPWGQVAFRLMGQNAAAATVSWQATGGTITSAGLYTAPAQAGTYQVLAQFTTDTPRVATATVVVNSSAAVTVRVSPEQVNLAPNGTAQFTAKVQGSANNAVTWTCSGGTIGSSGSFTAPSTNGTYTITATSQADNSAVGLATITVVGTAGMTTTYQHDLNGNLINDGARAFEWDAENRLVAVTITATGHRSEFGYDGMGRRVCIRELDPDQTQTLQVTSDKKYLWDGVEIAEERSTDGSTVLRRFYQQGFVDMDGTVLYYTRDHLGSIRELTDGTQTVRARYDYDPYGRMTKLQGDRDSAFTYGRHYWHAPSSLDLTMYRAYDPNVGRWLSRDPIEEAGGVNLYEYVNNRPTSLIDSNGLAPRDKKYGIPDDFWRWYHRNGKRSGDQDLGPGGADDEYEYWKKLGKPKPDHKRDRRNPDPDPDPDSNCEGDPEPDSNPEPDDDSKKWRWYPPMNPFFNPNLWRWLYNYQNSLPNPFTSGRPGPYGVLPPGYGLPWYVM